MPRFTGCDEEARTVLYILIKQNHIISSTDTLVWLFVLTIQNTKVRFAIRRELGCSMEEDNDWQM